MNIHKDFEEFLQLLVEAEAEFVIVGGYAVAWYGYIRATQDMDIFFRNTPENVTRVATALTAFGLPVAADDRAALAEPGSIIRLGLPPVRLELINNISGVTFDEVWANRHPGRYGDTPIAFIGFDELIRNKQASGRAKDLADVEELCSDEE